MFDKALKKVFGTKHDREIKRMQPLVERIGSLEGAMKKLSDSELTGQTARFKERLERGESLDALLPEAFATCREAAWRTLKMRHYDVQLIGGMVLHEGKIAEMKTGEGKTLVATLACYLNALEGKGVHVVTVNDYLASRDAEWMSQVYGFLGLSTGVIVPQQREQDKIRAYRADITYGQNNEFGFDYLRDNMKFSIFDYVQRDLNFAIIDEVDSILIDEARTPLIISGPGETASDKYIRITALMPRFVRDEHFTLDEKQRSVTLTEEGNAYAQRLMTEAGLLEGDNLYNVANLETLHIFQQCLRANALYHRDQAYMVSADGKVLIIDEFTGRVLAGRRWSEGLHQAIEAKERVPIQDENITLATISFQNLFRLYRKLSGMTGTADTEAVEFHKIYNLDVTIIPTNKPIQRVDSEDLIYRNEASKFRAIADDIEESHHAGQPVLIGTTSVEKSDVLSRFLGEKGIPHHVLNAKQHENEAYIVAQAGRSGAVTVATNMAGRGTDIVLGGNPEMLARLEVLSQRDPAAPPDAETERLAIEAATEEYKRACEADKVKVLAAGGLRIIGTERHESRRIDNQLRGRSGRQGDPGASRFYLSLEDDLMRIFAGERMQAMMSFLGMEDDAPIEHRRVSKAVEGAQKKVEERNFDIRKNMLEYDDVLNQQRVSIYTLRRQILTGQYRTVLTEKERKAGLEPKPYVAAADKALRDAVAPTVENMVRFHGAVIPSDADEAAARAAQAAAAKASFAELGPLRTANLEQDIYLWFGVRLDLSRLATKPEAARDFLLDAVSLGLTEQRERLYDLCDTLIVNLVETHCPQGKHHEDWDLEGLGNAFRERFGVEATGLDAVSERGELVTKLYRDLEGILHRKMGDFGNENFLRLFRNFFMQEIDRRWIEHLQQMDQLRDGIGLRGYGQRDPKKEYKKEGYELFLKLVDSIYLSVGKAMFHVERVREEDLQRVEAERRAQTEARQAQADAAARAMAPPTPGSAAQASGARRVTKAAALRGATVQVPTETIKRDTPKLGRNDACWCGSGKKYKNCHFAADQQKAREAATG